MTTQTPSPAALRATELIEKLIELDSEISAGAGAQYSFNRDEIAAIIDRETAPPEQLVLPGTMARLEARIVELENLIGEMACAENGEHMCDNDGRGCPACELAERVVRAMIIREDLPEPPAPPTEPNT